MLGKWAPHIRKMNIISYIICKGGLQMNSRLECGKYALKFHRRQCQKLLISGSKGFPTPSQAHAIKQNQGFHSIKDSMDKVRSDKYGRLSDSA